MHVIQAVWAPLGTLGERYANRLLLFLGACLFVAQGVAITAFATNLPFSDGWMFLQPDALGHELFWPWVWAQHNEHRLVWTKLLHWLNFRYLGYSLIAQASINYLLYACLVWLVLDFVKRHFQSTQGLLLVCLSSALIWEVHFWGFQTHFLLYPLCLMLALRALMREDRFSWLGVLWAAAGVYTMATGVLAAGCCALFCAARAGLEPAKRGRLVGQASLIVASIAPWCIDYHRPLGHVAFAGPWTWAFWWHLGLTFTRGMGVWGEAWAPVGVLLFAGFIALWMRRARIVYKALDETVSPARSQQVAWLALAAFALSMLLSVGVTSMARAHFGSPAPRHCFPIVMLMPVWWVLIDQAGLRKFGHRALLGLCVLAPLTSHMHYARIYADAKHLIDQHRSCAAAYLRGEGDGICDETYPGTAMPALLERARQMRLPFTQDMLPEVEQSAALPSSVWPQSLCRLDRIDDVQLADAFEKTTVMHPRHTPLTMTGWALNPDRSYPQMDASMALQAADGRVYALKAQRVRRGDVPETKGTSRYPWGVQLHTPLTAAVPNGRYAVFLQQGHGAAAHVCEARVLLEIVDPC